MHARELRKLDADLGEFVDDLLRGMGRLERRVALRTYVVGLLLDGERKSIEAMARRLVPTDAEVSAMRQRLQECVTQAKWADDEMYRRLALKLDTELPGVEAFVVDDTGFPKKGIESVGVQRQYSGCLGRVDNCQVAVSLHLASARGSGCIDMRLYLPEEWAGDEERRKKVGVPEEVAFKKKWEIALEQLDRALNAGIRKQPVLADGAFGDVDEFRVQLEKRGLTYVTGIATTLKVWAPGTAPLSPGELPKSKYRPRVRYRTSDEKPVTVMELATSMGTKALKELTWRQGSLGPQRSRFGALRVRTAHHHGKGKPPGSEVWLLWAWPSDESKSMKFWLSNLPATTSVKRLVYLAKLRWRVERDYQEMKGEVGLDHYEGRTWRGFHHHCALVAVAHAFLTLQRVLSPPIESGNLDAA